MQQADADVTHSNGKPFPLSQLVTLKSGSFRVCTTSATIRAGIKLDDLLEEISLLTDLAGELVSEVAMPQGRDETVGLWSAVFQLRHAHELAQLALSVTLNQIKPTETETE